MTDQVKREPLYQVWATETKTGKMVPIPHFPRIGKEQAEAWAALVREHIDKGNVKDYADPKAVIHLGQLI